MYSPKLPYATRGVNSRSRIVLADLGIPKAKGIIKARWLLGKALHAGVVIVRHTTECILALSHYYWYGDSAVAVPPMPNQPAERASLIRTWLLQFLPKITYGKRVRNPEKYFAQIERACFWSNGGSAPEYLDKGIHPSIAKAANEKRHHCAGIRIVWFYNKFVREHGKVPSIRAIERGAKSDSRTIKKALQERANQLLSVGGVYLGPLEQPVQPQGQSTTGASVENIKKVRNVKPVGDNNPSFDKREKGCHYFGVERKRFFDMQFFIQSFLGLKSAQFDTSKNVNIFAGRNKQGKSSLKKAIAVLFSGEKTPPGVQVNEAWKAWNDQLNSPSKLQVTLIPQETGHFGFSSDVRIYAKKDVTIAGDRTFKQSSITLGSTSLATMDADKKTKFLVEILEAVPSTEQFRKKMIEQKLSKKHIDQACEQVDLLKPDGAHKLACDERVINKRKYTDLTSRTFAPTQVGLWRPKGTESLVILPTETEEMLTQALSNDAKTLEALLEKQGSSNADKKRLEELKRANEGIDVPKMQVDLEAEKICLTSEREQLIKFQNELAEDTKQCPHCQKHFSEVNGKIIKAEAKDKNLKSKPEQLRAVQAQELRIKAREKAIEKKSEQIGSAQSVAGELEKLEKQIAENPTDKTAEIKALKEKMTAQRQKLDVVQAIAKEKQIADDIEAAEKLVEIFAPDKFRQEYLFTQIAKFEGELNDGHSFGVIRITPQLEFLLDQRPYEMLSDSEKLQVDAVIQCVIARYLGDKIILIDNVNHLDWEQKAQLVRFLMKQPVKSFLFMVGKPTDLPNLDALGHGHSYWISDGSVVPLSTQLEAATAR